MKQEKYWHAVLVKHTTSITEAIRISPPPLGLLTRLFLMTMGILLTTCLYPISINSERPIMSMVDAARGTHSIITCLFTTRNVERAIELTTARGDNAYSYYKYIKRKIIGTEEYRHHEYVQRVRHFQHVHYSPQDPEWDQLESLQRSTLREQYRVETATKPFIKTSADLDKALKNIHCIQDTFYEYDIPEEIKLRAIEKERDARERKHMKAVTISDLQTIISKAKQWRSCKENPWQLVSCALILCGRRVIEVISTLQWQQEGEYMARVTGVVKQDMEMDELVIPLLCPYEDFDELMHKIRAVQLPTESHTHRLKPAFISYFGQWYNHSQRRNIYGEAGFRHRHQTGFYPDMSKVMWIDHALCHASNVVQTASNLTYQSIVFTDERNQ